MEEVLKLDVCVWWWCWISDVGKEVEGGDHGHVEPFGMASGT